MKETHIHSFELKIRRIRADNPDYVGSTGDRAFILDVCKCGKERATDYGPTKIMLVLYNRMRDAQTTKLPA